MTRIGDSAFIANMFIRSIDIPESVTSIGEEAFYYSALSEVKLPHSITSIASYAFSYCPLQMIELPDGLTEIGNGAFSSSSLTNVILPESMTTIGQQAFWNCKSLAAAIIPASVTSIGLEAFTDCSKLTIYGDAGSTAESFAAQEGIPFAPVEQYVDPNTFGTCGENVTWELDTETGVLTISGTGEMSNDAGVSPWALYAGKIRSVVIRTSRFLLP